MTAEEESRETKQEQEDLDYMVMKVKPLSADRILASHSGLRLRFRSRSAIEISPHSRTVSCNPKRGVMADWI